MPSMIGPIVLLLCVFSLAAHAADEGCLERRGVLDVGSVTTKILVADVDTCRGTIRGVLLKSVRKVGYRQDLTRKDSDGSFSTEIQTQGLQAVRELKTEAETLSPKPSYYVGIATQSFRKASNGAVLAQRIHDAAGIRVKVIEQNEEALLGFLAATLAVPVVPQAPVAVWDIGGGSMQLTVRSNGKSPKVFENNYASETFKELVLHEIKKDRSEASSPNPLSSQQQQRSIKLAKSLATNWDKKVKASSPLRGATILAMGSVMRDCVMAQVKNVTHKDDLQGFTQSDVRAALKALAGQDDDKIQENTHTEYVKTEGTNPALVLGFMEALGIEQVKVVTSSIGEGVAVSKDYWRDKRPDQPVVSIPLAIPVTVVRSNP